MALNYLHIYLLMIADEPILLRHENSTELKKFVHTDQFALKKNNSIRLKSLNDACPECLCLYYLPDVKPGWLIDRENYIFYPAKLAIILPGQELYAEEDCLETRSPYRLHLHLNILQAGSKKYPGTRSNISPPEFISTRKLFFNNVSVFSKPPDAGSIFSLARNEFSASRLGMLAVNHVPGGSIFHYQQGTHTTQFLLARIKTNRIYGYFKKIISYALLHRSNNFITGFCFYHLSENA